MKGCSSLVIRNINLTTKLNDLSSCFLDIWPFTGSCDDIIENRAASIVYCSYIGASTYKKVNCLNSRLIKPSEFAIILKSIMKYWQGKRLLNWEYLGAKIPDRPLMSRAFVFTSRFKISPMNSNGISSLYLCHKAKCRGVRPALSRISKFDPLCWPLTLYCKTSGRKFFHDTERHVMVSFRDDLNSYLLFLMS